MPAAGRGVSIGVRVGSNTYDAVFFIKAKAQISLYCSMAFGYGFQMLRVDKNNAIHDSRKDMWMIQAYHMEAMRQA